MTSKKKARRARRPSSTGVLILVAALFCGSAIARLAIGAAPAIAREVSQLADLRLAGEPPACEIEPGIAELLADLGAREAAVTKREQELKTFEHTLRVSAENVQRDLIAMETAEAELAALIALSEEAAENDLARLTAVYENMKPKDTAALFAQMAPEFAAGFVGRMRPDAAAAVMTGLPAETAYSISVILAGRNANAPTE